MLPSPPLTDPDVQVSRIRFFTGEFRSRCERRWTIRAGGSGWRLRIALRRVQWNPPPPRCRRASHFFHSTITWHANHRMSVEALSRHPQIDLREPLGCWISGPITNQSFRRIICVLGNPFSGIDFAERVHACAKAIAVLEAWDPSVRTVAMPLLGTGNQGFVAERIAPALVKAAEDLLEFRFTRRHGVFYRG